VDRSAAALALSVVQGLIDDDPAAEQMALEAFDSLEEAATAYAYAVGYLVIELAALQACTPSDVIAELRRRLNE
jgi:hypothetical protein